MLQRINFFFIFSSHSKNVLKTNIKIAFGSICNYVFARPEYGNYYVAPSSVLVFTSLIRGEYISLFLTYLGNENYRIVNTFGYRCEEYPAKYRLISGPTENSLFVLEKDSNSDLYFIIYEFIENLSFQFLGTAGIEN